MEFDHVREALDILKQLGLPERQQNRRSALALLALLDLKPKNSWKTAQNPLRGIDPMMKFFADHYETRYAPNTRETIRKHTIHYFLQASFVAMNPDEPSRPTNSPRTVYQVTSELLELLQSYGMPSWKQCLKKYGASHPLPQSRQVYRRRDGLISVRLSSSNEITLSPGKHNELVRDICTKFADKFVKKAIMVYIGDTADKFRHIDRDKLDDLGVTLDRHGKIPDVIIYDEKQKWIFLVEAVTSHGPIDSKRRNELQKLFSRAKFGIVYVTAFADMTTMKKYATDISWQTEVWVADNPAHMIHFDGDRFMGPYSAL